MIDAATLTGACVIALGHTATGVMGNDDALVQEVLDAGKRSGEPGWPLPLWDDYKELIKSDVADIKNSGGRPAGTITAALFLKEFAEGYPWVHLDIAGTAYTEIGPRHGAARADGRSRGNVRRIRSRASALTTPSRELRVASRDAAVGCRLGLLLAGAVLHAAAWRAGRRYATRRGRRDTTSQAADPAAR